MRASVTAADPSVQNTLSTLGNALVRVEGALPSLLGSHSATLRIYFQNCPSVFAELPFTLHIVCDHLDTPITLTAVDSATLDFNFISDADVRTSFTYSHANCGLPTLSFTDQDGVALPFVTAELNSQLSLVVAPSLYSQVGVHLINAVFSEPRI